MYIYKYIFPGLDGMLAPGAAPLCHKHLGGICTTAASTRALAKPPRCQRVGGSRLPHIERARRLIGQLMAGEQPGKHQAVRRRCAAKGSLAAGRAARGSDRRLTPHGGHPVVVVADLSNSTTHIE